MVVKLASIIASNRLTKTAYRFEARCFVASAQTAADTPKPPPNGIIDGDHVDNERRGVEPHRNEANRTRRLLVRSIGDYRDGRAPVREPLPDDRGAEIADANFDEGQFRSGVGLANRNGPILAARSVDHRRATTGEALREEPGFRFVLPNRRQIEGTDARNAFKDEPRETGTD